MALEPDVDVDLLRAFKRGDGSAFEQLAKRHQDRIYRLCAVWLFDSQLAADATQETFLRALNGLRKFQFRAKPATWLYRTAQLVCMEFNRKREFAPLPDVVRDETPGPAQQHLDQLVLDDVKALIEQLSSRQREVVLLRTFEDLSIKETASLMGIREGTVKALMHKATEKLKMRMRMRSANE
ncbi:MAG: RNA polymerase sigma factor [Woeseiaceae bacterium]